MLKSRYSWGISEDAEKKINKQMETNVELKRNLSIYLTGLFGK